MSTTTRHPLHTFLAAQEALRLAQLDAELAAQALAALCPHQPGALIEARPGTWMVVERVQACEGWSGTGPHWAMSGKKAKKDGTAHATAWAFHHLPVAL